jgi:hypothetical protein
MFIPKLDVDASTKVTQGFSRHIFRVRGFILLNYAQRVYPFYLINVREKTINPNPDGWGRI